MIQRNVSHLLRLLTPTGLALSLLFLFVPATFAASRSPTTPATLLGPKSFYLALGDSLAYGYQPNGDYTHGYADYFYQNLKTHGVSYYANMGCTGETTTSMMNGLCTLAILRKYPYLGSQLLAAADYLHRHAGLVSPVTLDIGADDVSQDINYSTCAINAKVTKDLATMDYNLTHTILPTLTAAMMLRGQMTGDLLIMNYDNPYQNHCPNSGPFALALNQHLASDISSYPATLVDVFTAFGGAATPNPDLCADTWMCSHYPSSLAIHATDTGYQTIASTFEQTVGY